MLIYLQYDEKAIVDAVARLNPVSFAFEVTEDFMHYKEGVYTRWVKDPSDSTNTFVFTHAFTDVHE